MRRVRGISLLTASERCWRYQSGNITLELSTLVKCGSVFGGNDASSWRRELSTPYDDMVPGV